MAKRRFQAHPKFLLDSMRKQAGSLDKAILEGVMNAIEASDRNDPSSKVLITIDPGCTRVSIRDFGRGITTMDEIDRFFEVFGTPHDASENKIWAQFRMGRGQLFSFGKNIWRTGTFQLTVDINKWGLDYELEDGLPPVKGCEILIKTYEPGWGTFGTMERFKKQLAEQVEFVCMPVFFNRKQISTNPAELKWSQEDENAYYLWDAGIDLKLYNLGALVKGFDLLRMGVSGTIVSKKRLEVNFARNDVDSTCPVWKKIYAAVEKKARDRRDKLVRNRNREVMNDNERVSALHDLLYGRNPDRATMHLATIRLANGRHVSPYSFLRHRHFWCFAKRGDRMADRLITSHNTLVIDDALLKTLKFTGKPKEFLWTLARKNPEFNGTIAQYREFDELHKGISESYTLLSDPSPAERRILEFFNRKKKISRNLVLGESDVADGWTDGSSFIAITRQFLQRIGHGSRNFWQTMVLVGHELAHDINSAGSHDHSEEFYRRFHDIMTSDQESPLLLLENATKSFKDFVTDDTKTERQIKAAAQRDKKLGKLRLEQSEEVLQDFNDVEIISEAV